LDWSCHAGAFRLYDAHNHLQDPRLAACRADLGAALERENVVAAVVNGSTEQDWPDVLALAQASPRVLPSFGYHPWYVRERTAAWQRTLVRFLDTVPSVVGEIGLDRWMPEPDAPAQEEVFGWQLRLAAERNLPVSVHCLRAWGRLFDLLRAGPRPACGFLLHSYGGPAEMVEPLAKLGAYFSFPGYFAHARKERQRQAFRRVPADRFLIETDAPDQCLPEPLDRYPLTDRPTGRRLNHPANLGAVYRFVAEWLGEPLEHLAARIEQNFLRLFGALRRP
jgi:TatD DNase family protein